MNGSAPAARGRSCPTGWPGVPAARGRSAPAAGGRKFLPPAAPPPILFLVVFCLFRDIEMDPATPHARRPHVRPRPLGGGGRSAADARPGGEGETTAATPAAGSVPERSGALAVAAAGDEAAGQGAGRRPDAVAAARHE